MQGAKHALVEASLEYNNSKEGCKDHSGSPQHLIHGGCGDQQADGEQNGCRQIEQHGNEQKCGTLQCHRLCRAHTCVVSAVWSRSTVSEIIRLLDVVGFLRSTGAGK